MGLPLSSVVRAVICGQASNMDSNFIFWAGIICCFLVVLAFTADMLEAIYGAFFYVFLMIVSLVFDKGGENDRH